MIFNFLLKIKKVEDEVERLKLSIIYGWSLVIIGLVSFILVSLLETTNMDDVVSFFAVVWLISICLFAFRYTSVKPFLGAMASGITVVSIWAIIESSFSKRDNGSWIGAFVGMMVVLMFIFIKNIIVGFYYLIRETVRYVKYIKSTQKENGFLENTELSVTIK